jgi:hypothetical protein
VCRLKSTGKILLLKSGQKEPKFLRRVIWVKIRDFFGIGVKNTDKKFFVIWTSQFIKYTINGMRFINN